MTLYPHPVGYLPKRGLLHNLFHRCPVQRNSYHARPMHDRRRHQRLRLCIGRFHLKRNNASSWAPNADPHILADSTEQASAQGGRHCKSLTGRTFTKYVRTGTGNRRSTAVPSAPKQTVAESLNDKKTKLNHCMRRPTWPATPAFTARSLRDLSRPPYNPGAVDGTRFPGPLTKRVCGSP